MLFFTAQRNMQSKATACVMCEIFNAQRNKFCIKLDCLRNANTAHTLCVITSMQNVNSS